MNVSLKDPPQVVLYADASFCPRTRAAAWASYVVGDREGHFSSGDLPAEVASSVQAEAFALKNALKSAIGLGLIPPRALVTLYTDFTGHLDLLGNPGGDSVQGRVSIALGKQIERHGVQIKIRHIKAHSALSVRTPEQAIHAQVDRLARRQMQRLRSRLVAEMRPKD